MATTLAACELSGYSKSNHTFLWFSLTGSGFSSSLIKPSSSLCVLSKSNWNFISLAYSIDSSVDFLFIWWLICCCFWIDILIDCDWLISIYTNHSSNMKRIDLQYDAIVYIHTHEPHLNVTSINRHWTCATDLVRANPIPHQQIGQTHAIHSFAHSLTHSYAYIRVSPSAIAC